MRCKDRVSVLIGGEAGLGRQRSADRKIQKSCTYNYMRIFYKFML